RVAGGDLVLGELELGGAVVESAVEVEEVEAAGVVEGPRAELLEEGGEFGVRPRVEDHERRVDADGAAALVDLHGVGVAAGAVLALVHGDFDVVRQVVGGGESGDPGSDDSDTGGHGRAAPRLERFPGTGTVRRR